MSTRYMSGDLLNILSRGTVSVTDSDANYAAANLYDSKPSKPWMAGSNAAKTISVDGNVLSNGNLDTWAGSTDPTNWVATVVSPGTVTQTTATTEVVSGSAAKINSGSSGSAKIAKDFTMRAGERFVINGQYRVDAASTAGIIATARALLQNLTNGKYFSGSAWSTASTTYLVSSTSTAYTNQASSGQVESLASMLYPTCTLRLTLQPSTSAAGNAFFDDWFVWPVWNYVSVHGHNTDPVSVVTILSSTDNFVTATTEKTMTVKQPAFYSILTTENSRRHARVSWSNANTTAVGALYVGELVVGYSESLTRVQDHAARNPWQYGYVRDQVRSQTPPGEEYVFQQSNNARQILRLPFTHTDSTEWLEFFREIRLRTQDGEFPLVLIPDDTEDTVIFGRVGQTQEVQRTFGAPYGSETDLFLTELGFPIVGL